MITTVQQKTEEDFELLPDPERIVNGLRDTGYNFNTAVADIVDNSIAANATKISIDVNIDPNMQVRVYFADNGCGMDLEGLKNAMKYGSKERAEKNSLGKFGLGLKTASTAFCKQFSLISRNSSNSELRKVQWDLDYIAENGSWLLQFPVIEQDEKEMLDIVAEGGSGTLLVWEKIDRLMKDYKSLKNAQKGEKDSIIVYEVHEDGGVGRNKYTFDGQNMYVLYVGSVWNNDEDVISIDTTYTRIKEWNYTKDGWFTGEFCVPEPPERSETVDGRFRILV